MAFQIVLSLILLHFETILTIMVGIVEIAVLSFSINHVLAERKKLKRSPATVRADRPTFLMVISAMFLLAGVMLLYLILFNPAPIEVMQIYSSLILTGLVLTLLVSLVSIVLGSTLGVLAAILLAQRKGLILAALIDAPILSFIYVLLGIPALVLLYLTYYSGVKSIFWAAVLALSINLSPFVAKIVSSSIRNISQEQLDSAIAFGYSSRQITAYFKIGYVVRNSLQPLLVEYYTTIKLSSFAGLIGLTETYHASQEIIRETQDPVTSYFLLATAYVLIVTPFAILADYLERKRKKAIG